MAVTSLHCFSVHGYRYVAIMSQMPDRYLKARKDLLGPCHNTKYHRMLLEILDAKQDGQVTGLKLD